MGRMPLVTSAGDADHGLAFATGQAALADAAKPSKLKRLRKIAREACAAVESQLQSRRSRASSQLAQIGKQVVQDQRGHPIVEAALASMDMK